MREYKTLLRYSWSMKHSSGTSPTRKGSRRSSFATRYPIPKDKKLKRATKTPRTISCFLLLTISQISDRILSIWQQRNQQDLQSWEETPSQNILELSSTREKRQMPDRFSSVSEAQNFCPVLMWGLEKMIHSLLSRRVLFDSLQQKRRGLTELGASPRSYISPLPHRGVFSLYCSLQQPCK